MNILFLDTETTGFEHSRLIQLAHKKRGAEDILIEYFKPPVPIEFEAMGVHHITEKKVADSPAFPGSPAHADLDALLKDHVLVAHNAKFDIDILKNEGIETPQFMCTYKIAASLYDYPNLKLQSLRYRWGIEIEEAMAHDAGGDVMVLEKVFERMVQDYMKQNNTTEEETLQKFLEISSGPILQKTLNFGKLRGQTFEEIRLNDFSYLQWLGKLTDKDEDFTYTVKYYLAKGPGNADSSVPF